MRECVRLLFTASADAPSAESKESGTYPAGFSSHCQKWIQEE